MRTWLLFPAYGGYQSAEPDVLLGLFGTGGRPSSLEAASSQTWASRLRDTLTAFAFASRAHRKHSSALARYSAAVFMVPFLSRISCRFSTSLSALGPTQQRNYLIGSAPASRLGRDKIIKGRCRPSRQSRQQCPRRSRRWWKRRFAKSVPFELFALWRKCHRPPV